MNTNELASTVKAMEISTLYFLENWQYNYAIFS